VLSPPFADHLVLSVHLCPQKIFQVIQFLVNFGLFALPNHFHMSVEHFPIPLDVTGECIAFFTQLAQPGL
jgi:hypothetical protein